MSDLFAIINNMIFTSIFIFIFIFIKLMGSNFNHIFN